jgi:hypothetical protein
MIRPSLFESEALESLPDDAKSWLRDKAQTHSGWFLVDGRWQTAISSDLFIPHDSAVIVQAIVEKLRMKGENVSDVTMSIYPKMSITIKTDDRFITERGTSLHFVALRALCVAFDVEPHVRDRPKSLGDGEPTTLKKFKPL